MTRDKGTDHMSKIDALLDKQTADSGRDPLPEPAERKRLRVAWGLTQKQVADALGVTPGNVGGWEAGRWEPAGETRTQYLYLLNSIAERLSAASGQEGTTDDSGQ